MPVDVDARAMGAVARALRAIEPQTVPLLKDKLASRVEPLAAKVRSALPVRSGTLAGTVRVTKPQSGPTITVGGARAPYAGYVEFGGSIPGARPRDRRALAWGGGTPVARTGPRRISKVRGGRYILPTVTPDLPAVRQSIANDIVNFIEEKL